MIIMSADVYVRIHTNWSDEKYQQYYYYQEVEEYYSDMRAIRYSWSVSMSIYFESTSSSWVSSCC